MIPSRYNWRNLRRLAGNPAMARGELRRVGQRLNKAYFRRAGRGEWMPVVDADWDNLFLLDGCRYDLYGEQTPFDGGLDRRRSAGSDSREFLEANFAGRELYDTVYVSANPHAHRVADAFHHYRNLLRDAWDPELETVPPGAVAAAARDVADRFPDKRLVVHFMQPHFPFIGDAGRDLDQRGVDLHLDEAARSNAMHVWDQLTYGLLEEDVVWEAYRENLDIVLREVASLVEDVRGKSVVSTDHGNLVGDRERPIPVKGYGHPRGLYVPELIDVPWQVVAAEQRRAIRSDPPLEGERAGLSERELTDRLADLGYA